MPVRVPHGQPGLPAPAGSAPAPRRAWRRPVRAAPAPRRRPPNPPPPGRSARDRRTRRARSPDGRWPPRAGSSHSAAARAARCSWLARNRSSAASCSVCLASVTSWKSQPTPSGTGSSASGEASRRKPLRQHRRCSPSGVRTRHPHLGGRGRRTLGEHVRERALQLLDALREQLPQRPPENRRTPGPERPRRMRVDDGGPQIGVDEHDTPARRPRTAPRSARWTAPDRSARAPR